MTTERKYFSGNSLEIAIMQAARHHGLQPEEVAYRKIEKRHGFLRSRKSVVIEVDPSSPRLAAGQAVVVEETPRSVEEAPVEVVSVEEVPVEEVPVEEAPIVEAPPAPEIIEEPSPAVVERITPRVEQPEAPDDTAEPDAAEPPYQREQPSREKEAVESYEVTEDLIEAARRGLDDIMGFAKLNLEVEVSAGEEQLDIELTGPDRDRLIEDRGNLLVAIQHLLPRLIRGYVGRSIPCHVDSEDFHAGREIELRKLAEEAAQEVVDRQRPRTLPPMNPAERRIIHVTLADKKEISTESQGKGFFKRVTITPAMRRPRGFDRY